MLERADELAAEFRREGVLVLPGILARDALFLDYVGATASGCVLAPIDLPGIGLRALLAEINRRHLPLALVVIGRDSELASAVELTRAGAFDFLEHPFSDHRLRSVVRQAIGAET